MPRYRIVCSVVIFLAVAGSWVAPAWPQASDRDKVIDQALDSVTTDTSGAFTQEPSDARQAYLAERSQVFEMPFAKKGRHSFKVAYDIYDYAYQETVEGKKFANMKGAYSGVDVDYAYRPGMKDTSFGEYIDEFRLQGRLASGQVDYTGSGTFSGIDDYMFELRGLLAKDYSLAGKATASPYFGFGYRYLNNGFQKDTPGGYRRESMYAYLPMGGDIRSQLGGGWGLAMNLEYDWLISGEQRSHMEDVNPGLATLVNDQQKGYGLRGSLKVSRALNKRADIFVEPFFRYWDIEDSKFSPYVYNGVAVCNGNQCLGGIEPSNVTREVGIKMGVGF